MQWGMIKWLTTVICELTHLTDFLCHAILDETALTVVDRGGRHFLEGSGMAGRVLVNVLKGAFSVIGPILVMTSPVIRESLVRFVQDLYKAAKATDNKMDDVIVDLLMVMLGINVEEETDA